jgi:hypothetical protein
MRGARSALVTFAAAGLVAVPAAGVAGATTPPSPPPVSTAVTTTSLPGDTTTTTVVPGEAAPTPTTTVPVPASTPPRAGAAIGDLDRRADDETWSVRRLATATALGIAALALAGYVYGRLQSVTPRVGRRVARPLR